MQTKTNEQKRILDSIRSIDESVARIKISGITVYRKNKTLRFNLICDKAVDDEIKQKIITTINEYVPDGFQGFDVSIKKVVAEQGLVQKTTYDFIKENYMSLSHSVDMNDVQVTVNGDGYVDILLRLEDDAIDYFDVNDADEELVDYLGCIFCDTFRISFESKGSTPVDEKLLELKLTEGDFKRLIFRTFNVTDLTKYVGDTGDNDLAIYIADIKQDLGSVAIAGTITDIKERKTKKEKPYFIIELDDKTGRMTGKMFPRKDCVDKIRKLEVGHEIFVKGEVGSYKGYTDLMIKSVSLCRLPVDFVPKDRPSRVASSEYKLIKPKKMLDTKQSDLLTDAELPKCLTDNVFVVFDLETTGTDLNSGDKITEIGAVKIVNGFITEKFSTFVNPHRQIPDKIVELTGITNDMVHDAPNYEDVVGDFFKFCDGAILVGHNVSFDRGFIKYYSKPLDYVFDNVFMDTLQLSRENVPRLKNYKLDTVGAYFGVEFLHHRAWNDAFATAKIFIELIKIKKCLPNPM